MQVRVVEVEETAWFEQAKTVEDDSELVCQLLVPEQTE